MGGAAEWRFVHLEEVIPPLLPTLDPVALWKMMPQVFVYVYIYSFIHLFLNLGSQMSQRPAVFDGVGN